MRRDFKPVNEFFPYSLKGSTVKRRTSDLRTTRVPPAVGLQLLARALCLGPVPAGPLRLAVARLDAFPRIAQAALPARTCLRHHHRAECSVTITVTSGHFGAIRLKGYAKTL